MLLSIPGAQVSVGIFTDCGTVTVGITGADWHGGRTIVVPAYEVSG